jgi:hypothetical protein
MTSLEFGQNLAAGHPPIYVCKVLRRGGCSVFPLKRFDSFRSSLKGCFESCQIFLMETHWRGMAWGETNGMVKKKQTSRVVRFFSLPLSSFSQF